MVSSKVKKNISADIIDVIRYFDYFKYPPTHTEIHTFLKVKASKKTVITQLNKMVRSKKLVYKDCRFKNGNEMTLYALPGHTINFRKRAARKGITQDMIRKLGKFIATAKHVPYIRLLGVSGSCAMNNAGKNDDVDFFIITAKNRVWTTRFILLALAQAYGIRRKRGEKEPTNKACMNLLFDEQDVALPDYKRNLYTAHEVVQMHPLQVRGTAYSDFIQSNSWIFKFFPNFSPIDSTNGPNLYISTPIGTIIEVVLKAIQLKYMKNHKTSEIITKTQLWFFPDDFQKRVEKLLK